MFKFVRICENVRILDVVEKLEIVKFIVENVIESNKIGWWLNLLVSGVSIIELIIIFINFVLMSILNLVLFKLKFLLILVVVKVMVSMLKLFKKFIMVVINIIVYW